MRNVYKVLAILVIIGIGFLILHQPRTDRVWSEEFSRTAVASTTPDGHIHIANVRDWTYTKDTITDNAWKNVEVDPGTITTVWFVTEPFSSWKAVGHTFLTFEFSDGTALSFSIEARREEGESYSASRGLFGAYELAYQWGTERDFVPRRLVFLDHPVRRYPLLTLTPAMREGLFRGAVAETNKLAAHPRFYNTLTENCTNTLAYIVNTIAPHTLPYDISWNLTGYADLYLMRQGFIHEVNGSPEETRAFYDLTPKRDGVSGLATSTSDRTFTPALRALYLPAR